eukprot:gene1403-1686_t
MLKGEATRDASGNKKLPDIGPWLAKKLTAWQKREP